MFEKTNDVWSVKELQNNLHLSRNNAYALVNNGTIHSVRVGQKILIPKQAVLDFLLNNKYNNNRNGGFNSQSGKETKYHD